MRNKILIIMLMLVCLLPLGVSAKDYNTLNLDKALQAEGIEHDFSKYKETDDQAVIYLFRGDGCPHCQELLTYLSSIVAEHGDKFRVVTFESWNDKENAALLEEVGNYFDYKVDGRVPFMVIGKNFFPGYAADYNNAIIESIDTLYESDDRFDVIEEVEKIRAEAETDTNSGDTNEALIILLNLLFTAVATAIVMIYITIKDKKIIEAINSKKSK